MTTHTAPVAPASLTVAVTAYHDAPLLDQCLSSVRRAYPAARLIAIADGWDDPAVQRIARAYGAECHYGERLFYLDKGTAMWRRYFALYRQQPTDYFLRIDTDTLFHRPLAGLPTGLCYFGFLQDMEVPGQKEKVPFVQGGCIGFPAAAVAAIWSSGVLDDPAINERPRETWGVGFSRYMPDRGLISVDKMMGYITHVLGIRAVRHRDIYSHWYVNKGNARPGSYAVTHPHKLPDCRSEIALDAQTPDDAPAARSRADLPPHVSPALLRQIRRSLAWPNVDWSAMPLAEPTVTAAGTGPVPTADTVVLVSDDDTWHALRHLCGRRSAWPRPPTPAPNRHLLTRGDSTGVLWCRIHGACRSEREIARTVRHVLDIAERSRARLVLGAGPASGARPDDGYGAVNVTNTARFDLVGAAGKCAFNRQTYNNPWSPSVAALAAVQPCLAGLPTPPPGLPSLAAQVAGHATDALTNGLLLSPARPRVDVLDIAALTTNGAQVADDRGSHDHFSCIEPLAAAVAMACCEGGRAFGFVHAIADPAQNSALPRSAQELWGGLLRRAYGRPASFNAALAAWMIASTPQAKG